ncbi:MAG TPA: monofunctional biosynthetic peptidoglycan transglycosylase [Bryobacteraceae bacterium]|nr:monofunctional biosynthetic peptidoglycan transglycosylase [Bryobacteraceae bacterium]
MTWIPGGLEAVYHENLPTAAKRSAPARRVRKRPFLRYALYWIAAAIAAFYLWMAASLLLLRWMDPPFTAVQAERRIAAWQSHISYKKRYLFVPLERISPQLQHAVIAAEDARFFKHHGFDWKEIGSAVRDDLEDGRVRGASTIDQQLVRNLFLSTNRSVLRKGLEFSIVPIAELLLSKQRILELYLNIIEWGPGIYGAEAASRYYFGIPAERLTREQAVELAEVIPSPLHRKPNRITPYGARILVRMRQMGW